jgi:hypothetical protein
VTAARDAAAQRWRAHGFRTNAEVSGTLLRRRFRPSNAAMQPLRTALDRGLLSIRGVDRTMRVAGALADFAPCCSVGLLPGLAAMRQERRVTRLDRHYLRTSADIAIDDVGFIETTQPRPIAIGCPFRARTGRAIGTRHDVGADSIRAIGFHGRFGDGCWRRGGHRHCFSDFQCGR